MVKAHDALVTGLDDDTGDAASDVDTRCLSSPEQRFLHDDVFEAALRRRADLGGTLGRGRPLADQGGGPQGTEDQGGRGQAIDPIDTAQAGHVGSS